MMCQANSTAGCEDGVAPEGALHLSEGKGAEATLQKHFSHPSDPRFAANSQSPDEEATSVADTVPAANKSASLTPQNLEAKAKELYELSWRSTTSQEAEAAILSALSKAYEDGKQDYIAELESLTTVRTHRDIPKSKRYCSFCTRGDQEVGLANLVEGPVGCICGECAESAVKVIADRKEPSGVHRIVA